MTPSIRFGIERHGEPITEYPLKLLDTGITYRRLLPGLVPEIEEREAARFSGYTWAQWELLDHHERVSGVAYFRARRTIEMHQSDAQEIEAKRQTAKAGKGKRR